MAIILGTNSNNTLIGTNSNDLIQGIDGNDTIIGSRRNDTIDGDQGIDKVDYSSLGQAITLSATGVVNKGSLGNDKLVDIEHIKAPTGQSNTIDLSFATSAVTPITIDLSANLLNINGVGSFTVENFVNVIGTGTPDNIVGSNLNNTITGLGSNDTISGRDGNDTLNGNQGNDSLAGENGDDTFIGSIGNDTLNGDLGIDVADYSLLNEAITLKPTGIIEKGLAGVDQSIKVDTIIAPTDKFNTVDLTDAGLGAAINTNLSTKTLNVTAPITRTFTIHNFTDVIGSINNDTITGSTIDNQITGGAGSDTINGLDGDDIIDGGNDNDSVDGGLGNDSLIGSSGSDTVIGDSGTDTVDYSGLGQKIFLLPQGVIQKYTGNAVTNSDDLVRVENIIAPTVTTNNIAQLANTVDLTSAGAGISLNVNLTTNSINITGVPGLGNIGIRNFVNVFGSVNNDAITGDLKNNRLKGGAGLDTISGNNGNDYIEAEDGNDSIAGDIGNDTLLGGNGNDSLTGGTGTDVLVGANLFSLTAGNNETDTLTGGTGNDRFVLGGTVATPFGALGQNVVYYQGTGNAVITDYAPGADKFQLKGPSSSYTVSGNSIFFNTTDLIAQANVNINPSDLIFV